MADFVALGFDLAFKYRIASCILSDGAIGQMMEKVILPDQKPRMTEEEIKAKYPWATTGRKKCELSTYLLRIGGWLYRLAV